MAVGGAPADQNPGGGTLSYVVDDTLGTGGVGATNSELLPDQDASCVRGILIPQTDSLANCAFALPQDLGNADPNQMNVVCGYDGPRDDLVFTYAPTGATCDTATSWYYDNPVRPKAILFCPALCDKIKADPDCQLRLVVGCHAIVKIN
jgi:hypothetical protein